LALQIGLLFSALSCHPNVRYATIFDNFLRCVRKTAEVTLGGLDTRQLSSKTMAVLEQPNLFFIGEVVDVTGHLGGHNFQWAWASGVAAGNEA